VTLTYDLLTLAMSGELSFACPVHLPIFSILQLSVPKLCVTQSDHITFTWNGHCACAVSRDLSPVPNLPIHFVTFTVLRRILSHVFGEKERFPIVKATKLTAHAQYHVTCAQGVPQKTTRNNFLTPNCLFTIQLLLGYDDD